MESIAGRLLSIARLPLSDHHVEAPAGRLLSIARLPLSDHHVEAPVGRLLSIARLPLSDHHTEGPAGLLCFDCVNSRTPLMLACTKQELSTVQALVRCGASLSATNKDGWTPFHLACREGSVDIVSFLLTTNPGCWSTCSKNGRTPLHSAGENIDLLTHFN